MTDPLRTTSVAALGTTATVASPRSGHEAALAAMKSELQAIDAACSRFRDDSEVTQVNRSSGRPCRVSDLFLEVVEASLRAARLTEGLIDPTIGRPLRLLGYDRHFPDLPADGPSLELVLQPGPGWQGLQVDRAARAVTAPAGVELDFGSVAKAIAADRAARRAARAGGCGVLVSLGGDVSVAGAPPAGGWPLAVTDDHSTPWSPGDPVISIMAGGLATSSVSVRRWRRGGAELHHIIDPRTGHPAVEHWRTVSVAARSALDANIASCAAVILGPDAPRWLEDRRLPARLVRVDGAVSTLGGWPQDPAREAALADACVSSRP